MWHTETATIVTGLAYNTQAATRAVQVVYAYSGSGVKSLGDQHAWMDLKRTRHMDSRRNDQVISYIQLVCKWQVNDLQKWRKYLYQKYDKCGVEIFWSRRVGPTTSCSAPSLRRDVMVCPCTLWPDNLRVPWCWLAFLVAKLRHQLYSKKHEETRKQATDKDASGVMVE